MDYSKLYTIYKGIVLYDYTLIFIMIIYYKEGDTNVLIIKLIIL